MTPKIKTAIGAAAFALLIAGAALAYNALQDNVRPELRLAGQPENIDVSRSESVEPVEDTEPVKDTEPVNDTEPVKDTEPVNDTEPVEDTEPERIKAPDFSMEDSDGNSVKLSDMEGAPVVLNFWASWCPPCKAEMPEFDKVYAELGGGVVFMMVDLTDGQRETKEKGAAYVAENGFSFPVYYDTEQEGAYAYGIRSIPTTIFIDSEGFIITGAEGQLDEETLRYGISLIQAE